MQAAEATTNPVKQKRYKVIIHSGEGEGDKGDVVLVHNYKQIQIKRDVEVVIDAVFVDEVLRHSKIETVVKGEDGKDKTVNIPRFSYSVEPV